MSNVASMGSNVSSYPNSNVSQTANGEKSAAASKNAVSGRTIGNPQLSEKAAKYYESLKKKYSNMDFILVSKDQKEQAKAQASSYANANKMVVLIDEEKIEKMAEDEKFRNQYEGIIRTAATGISQLKTQLDNSGSNVKGYGMQINDNGTATYFAVLEKSSEAQRERIEKKAEQNRQDKKIADKKAQKKEQQERLENLKDSDDTVIITASSVDELVKKIEDYSQLYRSDNIQTEAEKQVGQRFDFSV